MSESFFKRWERVIRSSVATCSGCGARASVAPDMYAPHGWVSRKDVLRCPSCEAVHAHCAEHDDALAIARDLAACDPVVDDLHGAFCVLCEQRPDDHANGCPWARARALCPPAGGT